MTSIRPLELAAVSVRSSEVRPAVHEAGFAQHLGKALEGVEALQMAADRQAEALALGQGNLHETALALEKADVGMRVMTKVRNRFVEAYQEIMRMNV